VNVLKIHPERLIEGAVCSDDTQMLIEDQQRIAYRIHDPFGERARVIEIYDQPAVRQRQRG